MAPADAGKVDDHVGNEEANHAKDTPAGAYQRKAGVLKGRAEEVACSQQHQSGVARWWDFSQHAGGRHMQGTLHDMQVS